MCLPCRKTCVSSDECDYYFYLDSTAILDQHYTLKRLMSLNKYVLIIVINSY